MTDVKKGRLYIISGPSGSGKSTVLHEVFEKKEKYFFSVSATTREPRPGERDGVDYHFIERPVFDKMVEDGELLEHAEYVGNCYGTPRRPIIDKMDAGIDVILDIEVKGARQVKERMPDAVSIFIAPPSLEELERRLRGRSTETEEKIARRLETAKIELAAAGSYDHVVVNDVASRAADEILSIMDEEERS